MYKIKSKYQSNNNIIISNNKTIDNDIIFENILSKNKKFSIIINKKVFNFSNYISHKINLYNFKKNIYIFIYKWKILVMKI